MTEKEYRSFIKILMEEYKGQYGANAVRLAWEQVKDCRAQAMFKAMDKIMLAHNFLPPLEKVINETLRMEQEAKGKEIRRREEDAAEEKEMYRRGQAKAFHSNASIVQDSISLIQSIRDGGVTRAEALEEIRRLNEKYPSAGFDESFLAGAYKNRGLDMGKPCGRGRFVPLPSEYDREVMGE